MSFGDSANQFVDMLSGLRFNNRYYMFQFYHIVDLRSVPDTRPWMFDNILLLLHHHLQPGDRPTQVPLFSVAFWIQVHDLPIG